MAHYCDAAYWEKRYSKICNSLPTGDTPATATSNMPTYDWYLPYKPLEDGGEGVAFSFRQELLSLIRGQMEDMARRIGKGFQKRTYRVVVLGCGMSRLCEDLTDDLNAALLGGTTSSLAMMTTLFHSVEVCGVDFSPSCVAAMEMRRVDPVAAGHSGIPKLRSAETSAALVKAQQSRLEGNTPAAKSSASSNVEPFIVRENLSYVVCNAADLSKLFPAAENAVRADLIIDKALLDTVLCGDLPSKSIDRAAKVVSEVFRVLNPVGGKWVHMSHCAVTTGQRDVVFVNPAARWSKADVYPLTATTDRTYSMFVLSK